MFSQLSSFFSGLKSGKSKKKDKKANWNDGELNGSVENEYDEFDPAYFGCLGRRGSSDWNSRQRKNSKVASTQSLDKLGKQKSKESSAMMRGATSMLDLNSNKKAKSSNRHQSPKIDLGRNLNFIGSKDLFKAGVKSHRVGFGKFKEESNEQKEKKQKQKNEKLKRGASWRQAYRKGSIVLETSSNGLPRVNTEDRFIIEKSSRSSSNSSQNTSNETRQARLNAAPNQYSSTIHLTNIPPEPSEVRFGLGAITPDSVLNINEALKNDKNFGRGKDSKASDVSKARNSVHRVNSLSTNSPPLTPEGIFLQQPSISSSTRANDKPTVLSSHHLPPPPPVPTQHPPIYRSQDVTPFSALLRKNQLLPDSVQLSGKSNVNNSGYQQKSSRNIISKGNYIGGSYLDVTDSPNYLEKPQAKVTFNENLPMRESNYTPANQAYPRKGSLKVEDLVYQFDLLKFSQGVALSTPLPAYRKHQTTDDHAEYSNKKLKENLKTPTNTVYSSKSSSKNLLQLTNTQLINKNSKNDQEKQIARKLEYDGEQVFDTKSGVVYAKGKLLGKGGFAKCYEMKDLKNQKLYAGKVISKLNLAKKNQMEKILREVEVHFCLSHKNVVGFHSFFEDNHNVYIVLELCSRKSLVHKLKKRKTLTEPEVRYYMKHLTSGVHYIHSQRIIHRDLKLGNMLLSSNMELKIADFGLATIVEYEGEKKMTVCGTPNYIAPEVLQKTGHSYEADIWALGCIMYALLCGRPPFETTTLKETYSRIVTSRYAIPQHVSMAAKTLIRHLLTSEPYLRPSLEKIAADNFFQDGYLPEELSPTTCEVQPKFPLSTININNEANKKAAKNKAGQMQNDNLSSMAQSKNSRKSASQIITRAKASEFESAASSNLKDEYSVGSAPSIPRNLDSSFKSSAQTISPARLYHNLTNQLDLLLLKKGEPLPHGAVGSSIHNNNKRSKGGGIFVTKWVDYSNKYGFGFQLSNGRVGTLFNDGTKMLLLEDITSIQVESSNGEKSCFTTQTVPPEFKKEAALLRYFRDYMENHLIVGGCVQATPTRSVSIISSTRDVPQGQTVFLKKWFKTEKAVVMYFTDGTLQVNFFEDHTKVILNFEDGQQDNVYATLVDSQREASTYPLKSLSSLGCTSDVIDRLQYAAKMLEKVAEEEGEGGFIPRRV